jgi:hypothetical protein
MPGRRWASRPRGAAIIGRTSRRPTDGLPSGGRGTPSFSRTLFGVSCRFRAALSDRIPTARPTEAEPDRPRPGTPAGADDVTRLPGGDDRCVTLRRSGGLIGRSEVTVITPDGGVTVGTATLHHPGGAPAVLALARRLEAAGVYRVTPGRYLPARPSPDRFTYELTLVRGGQPHEYATAEGAPNVPRELAEAIRLIQEYAAAAR